MKMFNVKSIVKYILSKSYIPLKNYIYAMSGLKYDSNKIDNSINLLRNNIKIDIQKLHTNLTKDINTLSKLTNKNLETLNKNMERLHKNINKLNKNILQIATISSNLSNKEIFNEILNLLKPMHPIGINLIRIGKHNDGGYIMADIFDKVNYAFSFGISDDVSWDLSIADKNIQVYQFDPTIDGLPVNDKNFHFQQIGVTGLSAATPPIKTNYDMLTLNQIYNTYTPNDDNVILKMDIEGFEYAALLDAECIFNKFFQIVIEFHKISHYYLYFIELLKKLNITHQLIHVHGNNFSFCTTIGYNSFPEVIELTFLRKDNYEFTPYSGLYPLSIDEKNNPGNDEIILGNFNQE